jgi:hypothetical protein
MPQYVLKPSNFQSGQVGSLYNIGLSDGTNSYGYLFQNVGPQGGIKEETNIADKDKLIQYSSPNLIDRDLAFYPRVTQGDFSGGALQLVFLDPTKYFDSDLEIRTAGYLTLRPAWKRNQLTTGTGTYQCVTWNNDVWTVLNTGNIYNSAGGTLSPAPPVAAKFVDTDGLSLWITDGVNSVYALNPGAGSWTTISTTAGAITQMWIVNLGTNGRFLFYVLAGNQGQLLKADLSNNTFNITVPMGNPVADVFDVHPYQSGIAILVRDHGGTGNCDLWFHDGANMARIVRLEQYIPTGFVNCLGDLYVTAQSQGSFEGPVLLKVSSGAIEVVARFSSPLTGVTAAGIGDPTVSGQYVYFALTNPQISNVTPTNHIGVFDALTGAISHLGSLDTLDNPQITQPRQLATLGRSVAFPMSSGGNTFLQFQTNNNKLPAGNSYASSGTAVSSNKDFGTPGIPKRFRRIEAVHSPLAVGESITLKGFVNQDPLSYTAGLTPTATITNSQLNSTLTALTFGADTVGRTEFDAITFGGNGSSTPKVNRVAVEVGGTWTWTFDLDCTAKRRLLNQAVDDQQGVTGKDLYFLMRNAYENGTLLTLFLAEGVSYTVTIESLKAHNPAYVDHQQTPVKADEEWLVSAVLKQVA